MPVQGRRTGVGQGGIGVGRFTHQLLKAASARQSCCRLHLNGKCLFFIGYEANVWPSWHGTTGRSMGFGDLASGGGPLSIKTRNPAFDFRASLRTPVQRHRPLVKTLSRLPQHTVTGSSPSQRRS